METKLTVPISARDLEGAREQARAATAAGAEMLELRADYLENLSGLLVRKVIEEIRGGTAGAPPIIVTCRDKTEGGVIDYKMELRLEVLGSALAAGADFVDFEYRNFLVPDSQEKMLLALSRNPKARLILSAHSFDGRFANIGKLYRDIAAVYPATIPKLVYKADHINDCFEAFDLLHQTSGERIVFCMGQAGSISRMMAKKLESFVTFASVDSKSATAAGQLTVEEFKKLYRYDSIDGDTELYGVIGWPVAHSLSPVIHNACFARARVNKVYLPLGVEGGYAEFATFMQNMLHRKWLGLRGVSVTIPHKENALDYVRRSRGIVEGLAQRIGAVNTVLIQPDGRMSGYNTDYAGALNAITSALGISRAALRDMPVAVIGAGGVARAVVAGLSDVGAAIRIYNRTAERGERLAEEFGCAFSPLADLANIEAKLVINCTSIGMHPNVDATPVARECIREDMAVFDTVYNPGETLLLRQAKEAGAKTIDGLSMFINQACAQFELFTGESADRELMRQTVCGVDFAGNG
ncbi:MAG TPA: shikimate dehydrogenase [Sedimentisphaerales bacterium]|nr:shikimate dehydrogenase [Sedimentisphaerales bacterium]